MVIKTIPLSRFTKTMEQREGYSRGVQTGHRDFPGYAFTLVDEKQEQNQAHSGKTRIEYCIWKLIIVLPRKISVSLMNEPPDKTNRIKKKVCIHDSPDKCALLIQPAVRSSFKPWGSYSTKRQARACAPHTLRQACGEHTQEMDLQSHYQTSKRPFCV